MSVTPHPKEKKTAETEESGQKKVSLREPAFGCGVSDPRGVGFVRILTPAEGTGGNIDEKGESEPARGVGFVKFVQTSPRAAAARRHNQSKS